MVKSILPRIVAVVFIVTILMSVSFVPASGVSANGGNNLMEASTSDGVSLHPYLTSDTASGSYQNLIYASGLMRRDPDTLELIPNMAESWEISDDFLTYLHSPG